MRMITRKRVTFCCLTHSIVIMNVFRGDISRLTRQSYAEDAAAPSSEESQLKKIVPRCKPLRYGCCVPFSVDCATRRRSCCTLISKSSFISPWNAHIANMVIAGTVGVLGMRKVLVRQFLSQAQLIRPEVVANVINSSGEGNQG